jgi:Galactose mutarotase and related enzymes
VTPTARLNRLTIADGPIHVEVLPEVGARLHRLRAFGQDLLRTPDDPAEYARDPFSWGAYVMAPWCNRISAAPTAVAGQVVHLASNFPDGSAIHGQVYDTPWHQRMDGTLWVQGGDDRWPWPYEATLGVSIEDAVLTIDQSLTNLAETPMPAGIGVHPWFRRPLDVRINAPIVLRSNTDPDATVEPVSGPWDLRAMRPMPADLDAAWLAPGDPAVELRWPELSVRATLRARSDAGLCIVAASPSSLDAVAIEPQTHAPHGLRRFLNGEAGGLHSLAPGTTLRLTIELALEQVVAGDQPARDRPILAGDAVGLR